MIITEKLYKGEDKLVVFDLTDKNDNPVNFTDLLAVSVRILINKKPFEIYSSDSVDDKYKIFEVVDSPNSCKFNIHRDFTQFYSVGLMELELTMIIDDPEITGGRKEVTLIPIFQVRLND